MQILWASQLLNYSATACQDDSEKYVKLPGWLRIGGHPSYKKLTICLWQFVSQMFADETFYAL